jgi:hypothetical protein
MPQIIKSTEFKFRNARRNRAEYNRLLRNKTCTVIRTINDHLKLIRCDLPTEFKIAIINTETERLLYILLVTTSHYGFLPLKTVKQAMIWRDRNEPLTTGIPTEVFWQIFDETQSIITDNCQTVEGKAFWHYRIKESFEKGLNVYHVDLGDDSYNRIESFIDFAHLAPHIYGKEQRFMNHLILITKEKL